LAYLPLGCAQKLSAIATAGIGEYVFNQKVLPQKHHNEHGFGYRFGGGIKFALSKNWQTRFITRYVKFNHVSGYNHSLEQTLSFEYHF
jgi:opacity protein-like surface antigen